MAARLLVIDNYDSFTYNLVQMFLLYDLDIHVFRSDRLDLEKAERLAPDYLLISPGPRDPAHAGLSIPLIRAWYRTIPVLGVCLGMQCLNEVFGGRTVRAPLPRHGKTSLVRHQGQALFQVWPALSRPPVSLPHGGCDSGHIKCHRLQRRRCAHGAFPPCISAPRRPVSSRKLPDAGGGRHHRKLFEARTAGQSGTRRGCPPPT
jgi:anthranilate synthase/aminodeoxychorismate synthase-like glutamine amidotransferase